MKLLITFVFIYLSVNANSEETVLDDFWNDIRFAAEDVIFYGKSFLSPHPNEFYISYTTAGATLATIPIDQSFRRFAKSNRNQFSDDFTRIAEQFGDNDNAVYLSGGIYFVGLFIRNEEIRTTGRQILESIILSRRIINTQKVIFGRARPYLERGEWQFHFFTNNGDYKSLPSGPTNVAFTVSSILAAKFNTWWSYIGFYGLASATAYSRVYKDKEWFSDTVASAGLSILTSWIIMEADRQRKNPKIETDHSNWYIVPTGNGISLVYHF